MKQTHRFFRRGRLSSVGRAGRARGQALIWLLGTMAAAAAVMYGVYNVGQVTNDKAKTVNAADAAALAGATAEARILNLVAYNNRSLIANEVMLVQMLSIESWLGYVATTAGNFGIVARIVGVFIPPVQAIAQILAQTRQTIQQVRNQALNPAIDAIIVALEGLKTGLARAHQVVLLNGGLVAQNAATNVLQASRAQFNGQNDPGVVMDTSAAVRLETFAFNEAQWQRFTRRYSANQRTDAREVLLASRDNFSANRPGQPYLNLTAPLGVAGLDKRGGSRLQGFNRWEAQDTLELWQRPNPAKGRNWTPIGWGRANADQNGRAGSRWGSRTAQKRAFNDGRSHSHRQWSGVPAIYDIADKRVASRADLGVDFRVVVRRPSTSSLTTERFDMGRAPANPAGTAEMTGRFQNNQLSAMAKARVFFERPRRGLANDITANSLWRPDNAKEYGSLFSPYWQARLVDFTAAEKGLLMTAMGINPLNAPWTPGGQ